MASVSEIVVQSDVPAKMRDGVTLRADVYRPSEAGTLPVLLARTAYGKTRGTDTFRELAAAGYIVAVEDGYDAVMWASGLEDSTGEVGMFGTSLMGVTQWLAAANRPEPLKAIMPVNAGPNFYEGFRYYGGAFQLGDWLNWAVGQAAE